MISSVIFTLITVSVNKIGNTALWNLDKKSIHVSVKAPSYVFLHGINVTKGNNKPTFAQIERKH